MKLGIYVLMVALAGFFAAISCWPAALAASGIASVLVLVPTG